MTDIVSPEVRSRMMSRIRGKDTKPEMVIRRGLHALGFRYRLHDSRLPGKPDLVLKKHGAVIFVNGCFWHGHDCHLFKWPRTREEWWREKITRTREKDRENTEALLSVGMRVLVIWECAMRGRLKSPVEDVVEEAAKWLTGPVQYHEIRGRSA